VSRSPSVLTELCAGTFVLTRYVVGAPVALSPWLGSKIRAVQLLARAAGLRRGRFLAGVVLADAGTWGWVAPQLLDPAQRALVEACLLRWACLCPACCDVPGARPPCSVCGAVSGRSYGHALWSWLAAQPPRAGLIDATFGTCWRPGTAWPPERAAAWAEQVAAYLVVQAGNARGRPVEVSSVDGTWRTAGYGHLSKSARGKGFVERFDLRRIAARVARLGEGRWPAELAVHHGSATDAAELATAAGAEAVHLLDWPYQLDGDQQITRTGYQAHLPLADGCALAARLADAGGHVLVCEGGPVGRLLGPGWYDYEVTSAFSGTVKGSEWLTSNRPLRLGLAPRQTALAFSAFKEQPR